MELPRMSLREVKRRMDAGERVVFVDARNPRAWAAADAKLPGAVRLPDGGAQALAPVLPRDAVAVVYCT